VLARGCRLVKIVTSTLHTRTLGLPHHQELALVRSHQQTTTFSPVLVPVWRLFLSFNNVLLVIACMVIDDWFDGVCLPV
jgi:hypothetical protein